MSLVRSQKAAKILEKYIAAVLALRAMESNGTDQASSIFLDTRQRVHTLHGTLVKLLIATTGDL